MTDPTITIAGLRAQVDSLESNGKFYGSNDAWHVKVTRSASPPPNVASPDDDLPFATCAIGHEPSAVWRHFR